MQSHQRYRRETVEQGSRASARKHENDENLQWKQEEESNHEITVKANMPNEEEITYTISNLKKKKQQQKQPILQQNKQNE